MKRPGITPLGIALALALAATEASAQVVYRDVQAREPLVRIERVPPREGVVHSDIYDVYTPPYTPGLSDRYVRRSETVVVNGDLVVMTDGSPAPRYPSSTLWDPVHPHWGHQIDYGLFNRRGPQDFGQ